MFFDISIIRITFRHACMYLSLPRVQCITPIDVSVAINHLPSNRSIIEDTSRAGGTCRAHPDVGSSPLHPFSLSLFPPCRTTINLRCWPMLYTPSEKLPQHACTRGDVSLGTGIMLPRSRTLSRKVFRTLLCWIDDRCTEDGSRRRAMRLVIRYASLTGLFSSSSLSVPLSLLPRSSLLEDDDDDDENEKKDVALLSIARAIRGGGTQSSDG